MAGASYMSLRDEVAALLTPDEIRDIRAAIDIHQHELSRAIRDARRHATDATAIAVAARAGDEAAQAAAIVEWEARRREMDARSAPLGDFHRRATDLREFWTWFWSIGGMGGRDRDSLELPMHHTMPGYWEEVERRRPRYEYVFRRLRDAVDRFKADYLQKIDRTLAAVYRQSEEAGIIKKRGVMTDMGRKAVATSLGGHVARQFHELQQRHDAVHAVYKAMLESLVFLTSEF